MFVWKYTNVRHAAQLFNLCVWFLGQGGLVNGLLDCQTIYLKIASCRFLFFQILQDKECHWRRWFRVCLFFDCEDAFLILEGWSVDAIRPKDFKTLFEGCFVSHVEDWRCWWNVVVFFTCVN